MSPFPSTPVVISRKDPSFFPVSYINIILVLGYYVVDIVLFHRQESLEPNPTTCLHLRGAETPSD